MRGLTTALAFAGLAALGLAVLAGCSSAASAGATGTSCGKTRTGVNVPVDIMVAKGTASECHSASAEVVAVLSLPSSSPSRSAGS